MREQRNPEIYDWEGDDTELDQASIASHQGSGSESDQSESSGDSESDDGRGGDLKMPGPGVVLRAACEALGVTRSEVLAMELAVLSMLGFGLHVLRDPLERQLQLICEDFDVDAVQYYDGAAVEPRFAGNTGDAEDSGGRTSYSGNNAPGGNSGTVLGVVTAAVEETGEGRDGAAVPVPTTMPVPVLGAGSSRASSGLWDA